LKYLLGLSDEKLQTYFDGEVEEIEYHETFEVIVSCKDEGEQEIVYNKLKREGYNCRVLTL
jgi:predicted 3-demethylubiquinone-9 3-methyltransferase (glyoxalase superfamily)